MTKATLLAVALLFSFTGLQAQDQSPQASGQSATPAASPTVVKGCVRIAVDHFTLTDDSGAIYQMQGDTSTVNEHVGHEVQVTGSLSNSSPANSTAPSGGSTGAQPNGLVVEKIEDVSDSCTAARK